MKINFNTKSLIILEYLPMAGGKFISLCLAISEKILHQHKMLANKKIQKKWTQLESFKVSKKVLEKKIFLQKHFELGCTELAGFSFHVPVIQQESQANNFWKELTNQNEYKFFMVDHHGKKWSHYPNSQHIIFKNYDKILKLRNSFYDNLYKFSTHDKNHIEFDLETIFDDINFYKEISKTCNFLNIKQINPTYIEEMRKLFLKTINIGFK